MCHGVDVCKVDKGKMAGLQQSSITEATLESNMCHWSQACVIESDICHLSGLPRGCAVHCCPLLSMNYEKWLNCTAEPARRQEDAEAQPQHLLYPDMLSQMPPQGQDRNSKHCSSPGAGKCYRDCCRQTSYRPRIIIATDLEQSWHSKMHCWHHTTHSL